MLCQPALTASHAFAVQNWLCAGIRWFAAYGFKLFLGSKAYLASGISSVFYSENITLRSSGPAFCEPLILAVSRPIFRFMQAGIDPSVSPFSSVILLFFHIFINNAYCMKFIYLASIPFLLAACGAPHHYIVDNNLRTQELSMKLAANADARKEIDETKDAEFKQQQAKWALEREKRHEEKMAAIRAEYEKNIADIREKRRQADELAKKPPAKIGMSAATVREKTSWGVPKSVNRTTTSQGVMEQWVYEGGEYLYFRNGKLYAIQN